MDRRDFIKKVGGAGVAILAGGALIAATTPQGMAAPIPASKVMTLVERETISNVERSIIQSQYLHSTGKLGMENFRKAVQEKLEVEVEKVHWKEFRKIGKMQVYESKEFF